MSIKLQRQAASVASVVGGDRHSGWLPTGAAVPLPTEPVTALIDVRLLKRDGVYVLAWQADDAALWPQPSGHGERIFDSLTRASAAAEELFAVGVDDWTIAPDEQSVSADEVRMVVDTVLTAHEIDDPLEHGWGRLVNPPRLATFRLDTGATASLWLVLEPEDSGGYAVFYDGDTGDFGLAIEGKDGGLHYIGDYGPLWTTLTGM